MSVTRRIIVTGTGTGIGKTHASVAMVAALAARGESVAGLKPIESGFDEAAGDAHLLGNVSTYPSRRQPYAFADAVSPHLAARRVGQKIDLEIVTEWISACSADVAIIELPGALLSPLGPGVTNLDLLQRLTPHGIVLVAPDRLGVLHEVTACRTILSFRAPELAPPIVVLQPPASEDASTGTNAAEFVELGLVEAPVVFPRSSPTSREALETANDLLRRLDALG